MSKLTYERAKQLYTPYDIDQLRHLCALRDVEIDRLRAENAKLWQLMCHMYECMGNIDADGNHECDSCEYENTEGKCDFERRMRALDPALHPDLEHKKAVDE